MLKVDIFQRYLPEYRAPFFRYLSERSTYDITVYHGKSGKGHKVQNTTDLFGITSKQVLTFRLGDDTVWLQPTILSAIFRRNPQILIAEFSVRILTSGLAAMLCPMFNKPFIWWGSGFDPMVEERSALHRVKRWLLSVLVQKATAIIAYSERAKQYYQSMGAAGSKIFVATNSVDTNYLLQIRDDLLRNPHKVEDLKNQLLLSGKQTLLFVGRLIHGKNVKMLIDSFRMVVAENPESRLIIVGDGPLRKELQEQAADLGDRIIFTGSIHNREVLAKFFSLADLFILPGLGGLAIMEAMCFSLPVICTRADGTEYDLIKNGENGYILPDATASVLAEKIIALLRNEQLRDQMSIESLRIIHEEVNIHLMVDGFQRAIEYASQQLRR